MTVDEITGTYDASKHPDVIAGKMSEAQVLGLFLETFEMHHNIVNDSVNDQCITLEEFVEYYTNVSSSIDRDDYFALMMTRAWNLDGQKINQKGWASA